MQNTYISEEGLEKIQAELVALEVGKRREIAERIEEAKKLGDLAENAEYMEAKDAQAFNERAIAELRDVIQTSIVISKHHTKGVVEIGSSLVVKERHGERTHFTIVGSEETNPARGLISNLSPVGTALLGKRVGDKVEVSTPQGVASYEVLEIK